MRMTVKVTWHENTLDSDQEVERRYTVHSIVHGDSVYQWINTTREEAELEFAELMEDRSPFQAAHEPTTANGSTVRTDRQVCLWLNAGDQMNLMAQTMMSMFAEPGDDSSKG